MVETKNQTLKTTLFKERVKCWALEAYTLDYARKGTKRKVKLLSKGLGKIPKIS